MDWSSQGPVNYENQPAKAPLQDKDPQCSESAQSGNKIDQDRDKRDKEEVQIKAGT